MEASFVSSLLLHPVAILILAFAVFASVRIGSTVGPEGARLSWQRLLSGFFGLSVAAVLLSAASSYVSPEEARRFGVTPENYHSALLRQFMVLSVLLVYAAVVGCAVIGVPLLVALATKGLATTPVLVLASIPVSLLFALATGAFSGGNSRHLLRDAAFLVGLHAFLALGFAVAARLPWQVRAPRGHET